MHTMNPGRMQQSSRSHVAMQSWHRPNVQHVTPCSNFEIKANSNPVRVTSQKDKYKNQGSHNVPLAPNAAIADPLPSWPPLGFVHPPSYTMDKKTNKLF